tara:strand:- start:399 stop:1826 length:1428 start_codon:yes stop_codon:yes gene_type:complete
MEHRADNYECVQKYPILKGYLEHFKQVSINNEIPGLISFFFILGQAAVPYVRIPVMGSNLDPRVNMFWIQSTRTGKSAAYQIIEEILQGADMESVDYNSGNDAALVGTLVPDPESTNMQHPDMIVRKGILGGRKGLNFDEGSVILKTGQHNENTTLFLQSALNSVGTGRNILTKHMARDTFTVKSEVSLWATTYPPKGIKEHVLEKGIFQRVLTYWRHWTLEMKREVNHILAEGVYEEEKFDVPRDKVIAFFTELQQKLKRRILDITGITPLEWDEMSDDDKGTSVMAVMRDTFNIDDSYRPALRSAVDEYYSVVEVMGPEKQGICSSFIMGLQNYTNILAHHMAMIEGVWVVRGDHVDMAKEILFDLYQNLIQWLESEVKVGSGGNEKKKIEGQWKQAYGQCEVYDFEDQRGQGWVSKKAVMDAFGKIANLNSHASINTKYNMYGPSLFKDTREGVRVFLKLRDEHVRKKGAKK